MRAAARKPWRLQLLADTGITPNNTTLAAMSRGDEAQQLVDGRLDAALMLDAYQSESVQALLRAPEVGLANLVQAEAYAARQHALEVVDLPEA